MSNWESDNAFKKLQQLGGTMNKKESMREKIERELDESLKKRDYLYEEEQMGAAISWEDFKAMNEQTAKIPTRNPRYVPSDHSRVREELAEKVLMKVIGSIDLDDTSYNTIVEIALGITDTFLEKTQGVVRGYA